MKKLLVIILLFGALGYNFLPYNLKVQLVEKVGMDSSFIKAPEAKEYAIGELVELKFDEQSKANFSGNIDKGVAIKEFGEMKSQFKSCIETSDLSKLSGNTVFHRVLLLNKKKINITLNQSQGDDLNLVVYKSSAGSKQFFPEIQQVYDCDYSVEKISPKKITMAGNSVTSDIVIGVVGSKGVKSGEYNLELEQIR